MPSQRQRRVAERLRRILAAKLTELHDPDLVGQTVLITEVRPGTDLRRARVYARLFSPALPPIQAENEASDPAEDPAETKPDTRPATRHSPSAENPSGHRPEPRFITALNRAAPFLQHIIAQELDMKFTPKLTFVEDQSFETAERIEKILAKTRNIY